MTVGLKSDVKILGVALNSSSSFRHELRCLQRDHATLRLELERIKRAYYARQYDPNQPRIARGNPDGGEWTTQPSIQPVFYDPRRLAIRKAIEGGLALYTWLSTRSGSDKQAVIIFDAREFRSDGRGELDLDDVKLLDRDKVNAACPRLDKVQKRTDLAAEVVSRTRGHLPPAEFGTAVHTNLKRQIDGLSDPDFRAEVSYLKNREETYGRKDSIRIDVLEKVGDGTVCVYDIKTGQRGLSLARTTEIATNVFKAYPATQRILVSEIRPRSR